MRVWTSGAGSPSWATEGEEELKTQLLPNSGEVKKGIDAIFTDHPDRFHRQEHGKSLAGFMVVICRM